MGRDVTIAEAEPVRLHAVGGQFFFGMPGFVAVSPTALRIDSAAEGVHAGVEVRTDPDAVHPGVVADIDDGRQFVARTRTELAQPQQPLHAQQEPGTADSSNQHGHFHTDRH